MCVVVFTILCLFCGEGLARARASWARSHGPYKIMTPTGPGNHLGLMSGVPGKVSELAKHCICGRAVGGTMRGHGVGLWMFLMF